MTKIIRILIYGRDEMLPIANAVVKTANCQNIPLQHLANLHENINEEQSFIITFDASRDLQKINVKLAEFKPSLCIIMRAKSNNLKSKDLITSVNPILEIMTGEKILLLNTTIENYENIMMQAVAGGLENVLTIGDENNGNIRLLNVKTHDNYYLITIKFIDEEFTFEIRKPNTANVLERIVFFLAIVHTLGLNKEIALREVADL